MEKNMNQELMVQLQQLKRATFHYREMMSKVATELNTEQANYEQLKRLYEEQCQRYHELQREQLLWKSDVEKKREEVKCLKQELEEVTSQWRKARIAEIRNEELEEDNKYLERLVVAVAVSVPAFLLAEKQFRSKL